jgi:hypothetical protein
MTAAMRAGWAAKELLVRGLIPREYFGTTLAGVIEEAILASVREEREACAQMAEGRQYAGLASDIRARATGDIEALEEDDGTMLYTRGPNAPPPRAGGGRGVGGLD